MARVNRFAKATASGMEFAPGSNFDFDKKTFNQGQNRYRVVGDIEQVWISWVKDKEGLNKPIVTHGPDPKSVLYQKDDGSPTGEPAPHFWTRAVKRMQLSNDPQVKKLGDEYAPQPFYAMNVIDLDDPGYHQENRHTKLLANNEKANFVTLGIANDITEALQVNGTPDAPADYETHRGTGLVFITKKKGQGKGTKYETSAVLADKPLTDDERGYATYDMKEVCNTTPVDKIVEWMGWGFLKQHGVTEADIEAQRPWSPDFSKKGRNEAAATVATVPARSAAPVADMSATPSQPTQPTAPAEPAPSEPQGAEPSEPGEPTAPAVIPEDQKQVVGPDGAMLPPGVRWKQGTKAPYYWHVTNPTKTSFVVGDVARPR